jgi:uncharacterized protein YecT (DUF1311 family)
MKNLIATLFIVLICIGTKAQSTENGFRQITPADIVNINTIIDNKVKQLKKEMNELGMAKEKAEYTIDTFKVASICSMKMDINSTTIGISNALYEAAKDYDQLLNKYYNFLLKTLDPIDKKVLIASQKNWIAFRDSENKLAAVLSKEKYSGGGTIQNNIIASRYCTIVLDRLNTLFAYYYTGE